MWERLLAVWVMPSLMIERETVMVLEQVWNSSYSELMVLHMIAAGYHILDVEVEVLVSQSVNPLSAWQLLAIELWT
jgi:hypothetical protein